MSGIKKMMMKGMNMVMLDCDQATMVSTHLDLENVSFIKKLQLKMHLIGCKYCREYARQSKLLIDELDQLKEIDQNNLHIHLTEKQKETLEETIEHNI